MSSLETQHVTRYRLFESGFLRAESNANLAHSCIGEAPIHPCSVAAPFVCRGLTTAQNQSDVSPWIGEERSRLLCPFLIVAEVLQADLRIHVQICPLPTPLPERSSLVPKTGTRICAFVASVDTQDAVCQCRASRIILNGVSAARLTEAKPPAVMTFRSFASPA